MTLCEDVAETCIQAAHVKAPIQLPNSMRPVYHPYSRHFPCRACGVHDLRNTNEIIAARYLRVNPPPPKEHGAARESAHAISGNLLKRRSQATYIQVFHKKHGGDSSSSTSPCHRSYRRQHRATAARACCGHRCRRQPRKRPYCRNAR